MEKFTASNGVFIMDSYDGNQDYWMLVSDRGRVAVNGDEIGALREFFRHERDEELGRWRWPENPGYVVYPSVVNDTVRVLEEFTGQSMRVTRLSVSDEPDAWWNEAAAAYFAAHPEPKPWHGAGRDDVWKFTTKDGGRAALAWRSLDDWDVITPRGASITGAADPLAALVEHGFPEFAEIVSAVEMKAASNG